MVKWLRVKALRIGIWDFRVAGLLGFRRMVLCYCSALCCIMFGVVIFSFRQSPMPLGSQGLEWFGSMEMR